MDFISPSSSRTTHIFVNYITVDLLSIPALALIERFRV